VSSYSCFYYITDSDRAPVEEFIDSLDYKAQRKFFFKKGLLEEFGPRLPQPHAKYIGDDIYELRLEATEGSVRILYFFFHGRDIIFTNGFMKKSNKTPKKEKELALERRKSFLNKRGD
jgi:phage-related protein